MDRVKCFDVVSSVLEEATKRLAELIVLDKERVEILKTYCDVIDRLAEEVDANAFEANVNEETRDITVSIICASFEINHRNDAFYALVTRAKRFGFSYDTDDTVKVDFVFPSIWYAI